MSDKGETLTEAMLAAMPAHLRPIRAGKYLRAGCPFHGSESQRSLSISQETGRFQCFSCGAWGYTEQSREAWKSQHADRAPSPAWLRSSGTERLRKDGDEPEPLPEDWLQQLTEWQAALPEAAEYLASRRIPMELVQRLGAGVGSFGRARRLILPHSDPQGRIVSLYGRRIDGGDEHKHHHIADRPKGFLNAQALNGADEAWLTEGPFDALALMAAGIPQAVAVFGVDGIRWGWLKGVRRIVLAFDCDEPGRKAIEKHARQALMRGVEVLAVMPEELGGAKDISEAWAAGTLQLSGMDTAEASPELARWRQLLNSLPDEPPAGLSGRAWMDYRAQASRFLLEHGAAALAAGWDELDLFGIPPEGTQSGGGALWLLAEYSIREVRGPDIHAETSRGSPMVARRVWLTERRLPWA